MKRYIRIYRAFLKINLVYLLTYRANFINNVISSLAWGVFQIVWIVLLIGRRGVFFGWSQDDMILLTLGYFMVLGIFHFVFSRNFFEFSRIIDKGEFDGVLLKPVDSQFYATTLFINYASLVRACVGLVLIIFWITTKHYSISIISVVLFSFYIGVGVITLYSIWLSFITMIIWYPNLSNVVDLLNTVNGLARYPAEMIRYTGNVLLYILIPLALSISAPMKILLNKNPWEDVLILSVISICLFVFSRMLWKHALKYYTSAS